MRLEAYIAALLASMLSIAHAANLPIGDVTLSLGMEQADVINELRRHYDVVAVRNSQDFIVSQGKPPKMIRYLGRVRFENGRLSQIWRNWGIFSGVDNPTDVASALFSAIESAKGDSPGFSEVKTRVHRMPGAEIKFLSFDFVDRKVLIVITVGDNDFKQVDIDEIVSAEP